MNLLFIDLNGLKKVNESYGYQIGDQVIVKISNRLKTLFRETDIILKSKNIQSFVSRFGGDEFIVILQNISSKKDIWILVDRIQDELNKSAFFDGHDISIKCSVGISVYPDDGTNIRDLIRRADMAQTSVKRDSNSTSYAFYDNDKHTQSQNSLNIEMSLASAIEKNQLELHFQPIINIEKKCINGVESLLRWHHPVHGNISPAFFIPLAEKNGHVTFITQWVIKNLFERIHQCRSDIPKEMKFSFNVSAKDFLEESFLTYLVGIADYYNLPKEMICIEVTESMIMQDVKKSIKNMEFLRSHGFEIAIDDFGTGHSSFSYLHQFPISRLKIDKAFVDTVHHNPKAHIITSSIISMCHQLGIQVVAEGVETKNQIEILRKLDCENYQGFYFSKPISLNRFSDLTDRSIIDITSKLNLLQDKDK